VVSRLACHRDGGGSRQPRQGEDEARSSHERRHRRSLAVAFRLGRIDEVLVRGLPHGLAVVILALVYVASGSAMISATLRVPKI
jgi:hypothetical protein